MRANVNGFAIAARALEGDKKSHLTRPPTEAAMPANADIFMKFRRDSSTSMRLSRASFFSLTIVSSSSMVATQKLLFPREACLPDLYAFRRNPKRNTTDTSQSLFDSAQLIYHVPVFSPLPMPSRIKLLLEMFK